MNKYFLFENASIFKLVKIKIISQSKFFNLRISENSSCLFQYSNIHLNE